MVLNVIELCVGCQTASYRTSHVPLFPMWFWGQDGQYLHAVDYRPLVRVRMLFIARLVRKVCGILSCRAWLVVWCDVTGDSQGWMGGGSRA